MIATILLLSEGLVRVPFVLQESSLPGNVLFDPLKLSTISTTVANSNQVLKNYREAEIKHGRLAMLSAIAWPAQELVHPILSEKFQAANMLAAGKAPSILNGGLLQERVVPGVVLFFVVASMLEIQAMNLQELDPNRAPGDYKIRPQDPDPAVLAKLEAGEIWNARIAMMAILAYIVQEALGNTPVF
jgi:hypothetical protein